MTVARVEISTDDTAQGDTRVVVASLDDGMVRAYFRAHGAERTTDDENTDGADLP